VARVLNAKWRAGLAGGVVIANPIAPEHEIPHERIDAFIAQALAEPQVAARDRMLQRHPALRVVGCHLGSLEYDVDELAKRLDKYPNLAVDLSARIVHLQIQPRGKVRAFLVKYQDRLLYGTDVQFGRGSGAEGADPAKALARLAATYESDAKWFATDQELRAAIHLAREVLQPIRDQFGSFTPNSVFRGHPLERALKNKPATWLSTSQHSRGEACDIEIVGMSTLALANWAKDNLKAFDQIICECYDPAKGPNSGWVHISLKAPGSGENRRQLLSYIADHGKMVYVPGLRATVMA